MIDLILLFFVLGVVLCIVSIALVVRAGKRMRVLGIADHVEITREKPHLPDPVIEDEKPVPFPVGNGKHLYLQPLKEYEFTRYMGLYSTYLLALHNRADMLFLRAANLAAGRAYEAAGIAPGDLHLAELHDSFTVLTALQLEAIGFARRGEGWKPAVEGAIGREGRLPISTFGGLKARGNPLGATGVYQAVEVALQLRGEAGDNQVSGARLGLALNLGGLGGTAVAHVLERME